MAWIESHQSLNRHRKTLRASATLKVSRFELIGHLQVLWWWSLDNVDAEGCLDGLTDVEIAQAAEWDGDPSEFVAALLDAGGPGRAGFLEKRGETLYLHDWHDYAGKLLDRRETERERSRLRRQATAQRPPDVAQTSIGTVPNRTVPYPTQQNPTMGNNIAPKTAKEPGDLGAVAPLSSPPKKSNGHQEPPKQPLTEGQRVYLSKFGRKHLGTTARAEGIAALEAEVGLDCLTRALTWAAENSITNLDSIRTRARNLNSGRTARGPGPPSSVADTWRMIDEVGERMERGESYFGKPRGPATNQGAKSGVP